MKEKRNLLQKIARIFFSKKYDKYNCDIKIRLLFIRFKIHSKLQEIQNKIEDFEKQQILSSGLWDPLWYNRTYNHTFNKIDALDYWYNTGWRNGEAPSEKIDMNKVQEFCNVKNMNPIKAYLTTTLYITSCNIFASNKDELTAKEYLKNKPSKQTSVIYTCITNNYDDINEIKAYTYTNPNYDYVCFTDNNDWIKKGHIGIWEMRPLQYTKLDAGRNNRWHKLHPHELFPEYEESIYIDANINILDNYLFTKINEMNKDFIVPEHFENTCIFQEFNKIKTQHIDTEDALNRTYEKIKDMPVNYGFSENNILYRKKKKKEIIQIMEEWWNMVEHCSKRDQLSLTYILWKHNIKVDDLTISNTRLAKQHFFVFDHKKDRSGNKK